MEGLPPDPREGAGRVAVGEGPAAGLLGEPTRAGAINRGVSSAQPAANQSAARLVTQELARGIRNPVAAAGQTSARLGRSRQMRILGRNLPK